MGCSTKCQSCRRGCQRSLDGCQRGLDGCQRGLERVFYKLGHLVGSYPAPFLVLPLLICAGLSVGSIEMVKNEDGEKEYVPDDSMFFADRDASERLFPDLSATDYDPYSFTRFPLKAVIIFRSRKEKEIFSNETAQEILSVYTKVKRIQNSSGIAYADVCAKKNNGTNCAIEDTDEIAPFNRNFMKSIENDQVSYPYYTYNKGQVDLQQTYGNVEMTSSGGHLKAAGTYKMTFPLKYSRYTVEWMREFLKLMEGLHLTTVEHRYSLHMDSFNEEFEKSIEGDIILFVITFVIMFTYAIISSSGGDCVSTRSLLAIAGVMSAVMGIGAAFGFSSLVGLKYVSTVFLMPFLLLGVGVDDMFLMMSSWSETNDLTDTSVPERIGVVYKKSGIGITITSLTNFLAFMVGSTSNILTVRTFCLYTGVGVLFCYLCVITFFGACMTYHGRRVSGRRHTVTCLPVDQSRDEMKQDGGHSCCAVYCCGGEIPKKPEDDQSLCEKGPRFALIRVILLRPVRIVILVLFAVYLGASIGGITRLKEGLDLKDLVLKSSYYYKFQKWDTEDYGVKLAVAFVMPEPATYDCAGVLDTWKELIQTAQNDTKVSSELAKCWLTAYCDEKKQTSTNTSIDMSDLKGFLDQHRKYISDVIMDERGSRVQASRCYVYSDTVEEFEAAQLMVRLRSVAAQSPLPVFVFHPEFVFYEQYVTVKDSILKNIGITAGVMCLVACIFLPEPTMVAVVMVQVAMIITGVFGFMGYWGLTLSPVTMICLIMAMGFSVDFCAHVCSAYLASDSSLDRHGRARESLLHASGPILNGGFTSLLGVLVLSFSDSNIFQSFFQIMVLVVGFGTLHAVALIPVVLSFVGPQKQKQKKNKNKNKMSSSGHRPAGHEEEINEGRNIQLSAIFKL